MQKKMYSTPVVVLAIVGACLTLLMNCIFLGVTVVTSVTAAVESFRSENIYDAIEPYIEDGTIGGESGNEGGTKDDAEKDMEGVDPSTEALADIPTYTAEGTTVTYETETYQLTKKIGNSGAVLLNVKYPVISGIDEAKAAEINKALMDQAMVSADQYYLNVAERSKVEGDANGSIYIISEVNYQVTYLSNDFISVVYEDNYCPGNYSTQYMDMRSCNIDLNTGKSYELSEIVNADEDLADDFQDELDDKYQYNEVIEGISKEEYVAMLKGEKTDDGSFMGFYRTQDGLQLYVTFHYYGESTSVVGWLTAPYSLDDIKEYAKDSDLWTILQ